METKEKQRQANTGKSSKKPYRGSVLRTLWGTIVAAIFFVISGFLILWAYEISMQGSGPAVFNWILTVFLIILIYLHVYGILGKGLFYFMNAKSKILKFLGGVFIFFGAILRPYVLKAYGATKKWVFLLFAVFPYIIIAMLGIIEFLTGSILSSWQGDWHGFGLCLTIFSIFHCIIACMVKKCPNCKRIMTDIDTELLDFSEEHYTREMSRNVGSISYGNGQRANVYEHYNADFKGYRDSQMRVYKCKACGQIKNGLKFSYVIRDQNDFIE